MHPLTQVLLVQRHLISLGVLTVTIALSAPCYALPYPHPSLPNQIVNNKIQPPTPIAMNDDNGQAVDEYQLATVSGTVTYLQRIALPPHATVVVKLEEVSRADAPSVMLDEQVIETNGQQVPIPFTLTYDPAKIQQRFRYVVRAQIFYGDRLRWTSTKIYSVITQDNPTEVEIQLEQVR